MSRRDISAEVRDRVRQQVGNRCGYCLSPQRLVLGRLEIEHIIPSGAGGSDRESNLWLACSLCNFKKGPNLSGRDPVSANVVPLFHPRLQRWGRHFRRVGATLVGRTQTGRATVAVLDINEPIRVRLRQALVDQGESPGG